MGKQLGGINGPFVGRVGNAVGYMWRGQWCVRALPREFHDAKTDKQLEQRELFKASVGFAGRLKDILRIGFELPALKVHKTVCNYFLMVNKGRFVMDGETLVADYEHLRLSEGPVAPVAFTGVHEGTLPQEIILDFEKNPEHRNCNGNDRVYVAAINASRCEAVLSLPVYRRMGSITLTLPSYWENDEVHLYGFVQDNAGRCSESIYINFIGVKGCERTNVSDENDENYENYESHENYESYGNPGVERNGAGRGGGKGGGGDGN